MLSNFDPSVCHLVRPKQGTQVMYQYLIMTPNELGWKSVELAVDQLPQRAKGNKRGGNRSGRDQRSSCTQRQFLTGQLRVL